MATSARRSQPRSKRKIKPLTPLSPAARRLVRPGSSRWAWKLSHTPATRPDPSVGLLGIREYSCVALPSRGALATGSEIVSEDRFPRSCVNKSGFPGPGAPFIDMCVAHIRRHRPPPIPQLCRRGPASGARSPLRCSRTKGLDPPRLRGHIRPGSRGPRAACRLLQSKRSLSTTA